MGIVAGKLVCVVWSAWRLWTGGVSPVRNASIRALRIRRAGSTLVSWFQVPLDARHLVRSERYFLARLSNKTVDVVCYDVLVHGTTISGVASCCRGYNSTHVTFCIDNTAWIPSVYKLEQA